MEHFKEHCMNNYKDEFKKYLKEHFNKQVTLKAFKKRFRRIISAISYQHPSNGGVVQVQSALHYLFPNQRSVPIPRCPSP